MCGSLVTSKKRERFLNRLADTGSATLACDYAPVNRRTIYRLKAEDEGFRAEWNDAMEVYLDKMEREADRRAIEGVPKFKVQAGKAVLNPITGLPLVEREYSDVLLMFRMKAAAPHKYRDNMAVDHTTKGKALEANTANVFVFMPSQKPVPE